MIKKVSIADLQETFRSARNQVTLIQVKKTPEKKKSPFGKSTKYTSFLQKYMDEKYEDFNLNDLAYYFREMSNSVGGHYIIANWQKEISIFKKLKERYEVLEICLMIEFLFKSNQDYLDKSSLAPQILLSSWCNTVYADSQKWLEGEYVPRKKKKKVIREYGEKDIKTSNTSIGEWE